MTMDSFNKYHKYTASPGLFQFWKLAEQSLNQNYPPYNIIKGDATDSTQVVFIDIALAGFSKDDVKIKLKDDTLSVSSDISSTNSNTVFIHKGIAARSFNLSFYVPGMEVISAKFENGILRIELHMLEDHGTTITIQ